MPNMSHDYDDRRVVVPVWTHLSGPEPVARLTAALVEWHPTVREWAIRILLGRAWHGPPLRASTSHRRKASRRRTDNHIQRPDVFGRGEPFPRSSSENLT
jgi:hypothetical protein